MDTKEFMAEYYSALQVRSAVRINNLKEQDKADIAIKMLEMQAKVEFSNPEQQSENERFIERNRSEMEDFDVEFLEESHRSYPEVCDYLEMHDTTLRRRMKTWGIKAVTIEDVKLKQIPTIPIFEARRDGKT